MTRLNRIAEQVSRRGIRFLALEFLIVFLGVYLAFLFQEYGEDRDLAIERNKIVIGLKEDLEHLRIFFPEFASSMARDVAGWSALIDEGTYRDFSDWRFIQPQFDLKTIEYALAADAEIIDFESNSTLAELFEELEKLQHAENLMTEVAMRFRAVPEDIEQTADVRLVHAENALNFRRLRDRAQDRVNILRRTAELARENLAWVDASFSPEERQEIELLLIRKTVEPRSDQQRMAYLKMLQRHFPHLPKEALLEALQL